MWHLYFLAFLIHTAYSCQDGVEIVSKELENYEDAIGNWSYVYHWDSINKFPIEFIDNGDEYAKDCPTIAFTAAPKELIEEKKKECAEHKYPFDWKDAKLIVEDPLVIFGNMLIIFGQTEKWMFVDCSEVRRINLKYVTDDYMVAIFPDEPDTYELMSKKIPKTEELKCIAHNVDIGKGMQGSGLCI